jgi:iron complex transport system substrate-binding protein
MTSRSWAARSLATLGLALLIACGTGPEAPEPTTVPARIVSMAPSLTEILFALELGDRVVGVTSFCDFPPEARELPEIGGFINPSVEAILALEPDLVIVSPAAGNRDAALAVRGAGVRLEVVPAETLDDTFDAIRSVAELCGVPERGEELAGSLRRRIDRVSESVAGLARVRALYCIQIDPLIAAGRGTLPAELMELAGGANVVDGDRYPRIGIESVLAEAPEVILQSRMDTSDPGADRASIDYWSQWASIPAVRDGRVFVFDGTTSLRAGPRVAEAVELIARSLHPREIE